MRYFLLFILLVYSLNVFAAHVHPLDDADSKSVSSVSISIESEEERGERPALAYRVVLGFDSTLFEGLEHINDYSSVIVDISSDHTLEDLLQSFLDVKKHITETNAWWYGTLFIQKLGEAKISFGALYSAFVSIKPFRCVELDRVPLADPAFLIEGNKDFSTLSLIGYSLDTHFFALFSNNDFMHKLKHLDLSKSILQCAFYLVAYERKWFERLPLCGPNRVSVAYKNASGLIASVDYLYSEGFYRPIVA